MAAMKQYFSLLFAVTLLFCLAQASQSIVPAELYRSLISRSNCKQGCSKESCTDGLTVMCLSCTKLAYCTTEGTVLASSQCKDVNPKTPFCDTENHKCVESNSCAPVTIDCPYKGFFPNLNDCNSFFYCTAPKTQGLMYRCPSSTKYDHAKQVCGPSTTRCPNFASTSGGLCYNKMLQAVAHPDDPSVYALCGPEGPVMLGCASKDERMVKLGHCETNCRKEGFFPDITDKSNVKYVTCVREGSIIKSYPQICPLDMEWNTADIMCKAKE